MGALYQLTFPNGKSYVGITAGTVAARFKEHTHAAKRGLQYAVYRALRKYGPENVRVKTLAIADDWGYLQTIEQNAIRVLGTFKPAGYNLTKGGEGILGATMSESAREKQSAAKKGRQLPSGHKENIRLALLGNKYAEGTKQSAATKTKRIRSALLREGAGVTFDTQTQKWRAHISVGGKMRHLGRFTDRESAIAARRNAVAAHLQGVPA